MSYISLNENLLKIITSTFYFILTAYLSLYFGCVGKQLDKKAKENFKIYEITNWISNNCNKHIAINIINILLFDIMKFGKFIE